jgi:hypothetical protein
MTESYKRANYQLRPAKHAERMMMCDAFRRLKFGSVESYQYVGLVLLCHKVRRCVLRWQHGHLGIVRAMARAMTTRTEEIELAT